MTWTSTIEYNEDRTLSRIILRRDDGKILDTKWWPLDGSAQCEASKLRGRIEAKERELAEGAARDIGGHTEP